MSIGEGMTGTSRWLQSLSQSTLQPGLASWRDLNADGVSQPDEVAPLDSWGVNALSVSYRGGDEDLDVLASSVAGARFSDGTVRPTYDILLHAH